MTFSTTPHPEFFDGAILHCDLRGEAKIYRCVGETFGWPIVALSPEEYYVGHTNTTVTTSALNPNIYKIRKATDAEARTFHEQLANRIDEAKS